MLAWFRMYSDCVDNAKLRVIAFEDRWHFVAVLCCKAQGILDSTPPGLLERILGVKLGLDSGGPESSLAKVKARLMEVNLIDANWQPIGWPERQFASDHSGADRKRKQRERDRQRACHTDVTVASRDRPGLEQNRTEQNRTEKTPAKRACALPEDFGLTEEREKYARDRLPKVDTTELLAAFHDYHAKEGTTAKDWDAAWRTWVRNALQFGYPKLAPGAARHEPTQDEIAEAHRRAAEDNRRELTRKVGGVFAR